MNFRDLAKALLPPDFDPELFEFCGDEVEQYICSYCSIPALPDACVVIAARMLAEVYLEDGKVAASSPKTITRGDFSVSFSEQNREHFASFDARLNAFRRLPW
ncbi:MAG: hypothetical protein ACOX6P_06665 [Candidatus Merdivicinus sp.]